MKQLAVSFNSADGVEFQHDNLIKELSKGIYRKAIFHVFSGIEDTAEILKVTSKLKEDFPGTIIVGTLSAGEICDGHIPPKGISASVLLFENAGVDLIKCVNVKGNEKASGEKIVKEASKIKDVKAVEILLPGTEFDTQIILDELSKLGDDIAVFGGYSGGHNLEESKHFIFDGDGIDYDAIYAIVYSGKDLHINVDKSAGWEKLGMPFKITKADGNRLVEIDNNPAVEVYEKYLKITDRDSFAEETFEFPLAAWQDNEELLRHTITVEDDGTLVLAGYVSEGMDVYLSYGNPDSVINMVNNRLIAMEEFSPEAILLYSCSVRKAFWEDFAEIEIKPFEDIAPVSGFYTWGEVMRNQDNNKLYEYNITMLSIGMREGDKKKNESRGHKVDDSVLSGQSSLLKRLTKLVAATTGELQKAYSEQKEINEKLRRMADYDALTDIYNRRKIEEMVVRRLNETAANNSVASLIMVDVDHFKYINDAYGHRTGDTVLHELASILKQEVKGCGGNLGRWGGEEFFFVIPGMDKNAAYDFAESLRKKVENAKFTDIDGLTISLGVLETDGKDQGQEDYTKVDNALYEAKAKGRNMTVVA